MASKTTTKIKILDAAEQLFAAHGFAETSMREITSKAGVNLASVNYHFGSKKVLIQAVIDRYLQHFMPELMTHLVHLKTKKTEIAVNDVFQCFKSPLLNLQTITPQGTYYFLQLLGRGYIDSQGHLRRFITEKYQSELIEIRHACGIAKPELSDEDIFWRLHFTLGTAVFTLAAAGALTDIAKSDFGQENKIEDIIDKLIPYIAAGFSNS